MGLYAAGKDGVIRLLESGLGITKGNYSSLYLWRKRHCCHSLLDVHKGNIVAVGGLSIGSECCVSLRENGLFQVWKTTDGTVMGRTHLNEPGSVLACSPIAHYAAVGTTQGIIFFVDASKPQTPRVIMRHRLFRQAVHYLTFNGDDGRILFAASNDCYIFLIDGRPSSGFAILGFLSLTGTIQAIAANHYGKDKSVLVAACNNKPEIKGANLLHKYTFTSSVLDDIHHHYKSSMCDIDDQACSALKMGLRHAISGLAIGDGEILYALSASNKKILTFVMPVQDSEKTLKKSDLLLTPTGEYPGHQLTGGNVLVSPHLKWLLSYSCDGTVKLRNVSALDRTAIFPPHEYRPGGIKFVTISDDCQYILSCGFDETITCYHWNHLKGKGVTSVYKQRRNRDMDLLFRENHKLSEFHEISNPLSDKRRASELERERKELIELAKQKAQDNDEIYVSPPPSPRMNATWLEQRQIDKNKHFASIKYDLRSQIRDIRRTIQQMMAENRDLPEIEKLGRHEFDLDLEEQSRLQQEGEAEVQKVRETIEFENLAKLYIRDKIKRRMLGQNAFNSSLEVSNFPLRERTIDQLNLIKTVSVRRSIEKRELEARKKLAEINTKAAVHVSNISNAEPFDTWKKRLYSFTLEEEIEGDDDESSKEQPSITGSLGAQYGGSNPLFYSQFELHSREQKIYQIIMLEDAIHRIKENFNKDFDEVFSKKEQEIAKVKEKNKRISKIITDLYLDESIIEPTMSIAEKPELLLDVADSEIRVEKYLTPEQRKKLEEEKLIEEERLARERGDNARERALEMMMGGVLEIKKEDELKKDVPKPAFMLTKKEDEYSEEEMKTYKEYLKKVQDLNEEREKFRKQLEAELRKLQATIQEGLQAFDEALNVLFMRKIKVMMVIYQEELKILRLRFSMLIHEEINIRDNDLHQTLEHKRQLKQQAFEALTEARKNIDSFRNEYEHLQAEDKYLDKSFRREFTDASGSQVDTLYKQFKRRPRTQKYKSIDGIKKVLNPFADRPSSAVQLNHLKGQLATGLDELDKPSNLPEGIEHHLWEKMCKLRRNKVESELQLKLKANALAEIQAFVHKRQDEDERLKTEIEQLTQMIAKIKEDEQRFILNLEVQLDSVLVHRNVVEDLNATIKQLGERKIASMVESKDFRKGIIQLEWEHKKMSMQMEDLENKLKDIQFIKVTREIQAYLHEEDYEAKKADEISTLEQTVLQLKKFHEKTIAHKKQLLREMAKSTKNKALNNKKLDAELLDLNVVVNERKQIEDINIENRDDDAANRHYQEIVQRRKMVDLAKAQAQEVAILRAEVERLRMRTFPALVQVER
ncbi:Cilia- and flagella-associated protein 43 [Bulinus truncatus]|nr:Cilia- and flagella-associated protein 43 [Bulinus truncatus]